VNNITTEIEEAEVEHALSRDTVFSMGKGTAITFFTSLGYFVISFISRVIILRLISVEEWGQFSLAVSLIALFSMIAPLGLDASVARNIAYFGAERKGSVAWNGLVTSAVLGVLFAAVIFVISPSLGKVFHEPFLPFIIMIFSPALFFGIVSQMVASIARGNKNTAANALFINLLPPTFFTLFSLILYYSGLRFYGVILGNLIAAAATSSLSFVYALRKGYFRPGKGISASETKFLLLFGIPIMMVGFSSYFMIYADTLILGFFKNAVQVGYYAAALSVSKLSFLGINALGYIILPVASGLVSRRRRGELSHLYKNILKWNLVASVPIFLLFVAFPAGTLTIAFGSRYGKAAIALQILAFGSFINALLGPSSPALAAAGRTRLVALSGLLGAAANILLSVSLIPYLGFVGAAVASVTGSFIYRLFCMVFFAVENKFMPFTMNFLKPLLVSTSFPLLLFVVLRPVLSAPLAVLILIGTSSFTVFAILITASLEEADVFILEFIEHLFGRKLSLVRKIGRVFLPSDAHD
jgi:O-antigen/teichoic acid export membrane protein